ncbi:MAG: hypothetical protein ACRCRZ_03120 [Metamycoplasmataceae bacterium]
MFNKINKKAKIWLLSGIIIGSSFLVTVATTSIIFLTNSYKNKSIETISILSSDVDIKISIKEEIKNSNNASTLAALGVDNVSIDFFNKNDLNSSIISKELLDYKISFLNPQDTNDLEEIKNNNLSVILDGSVAYIKIEYKTKNEVNYLTTVKEITGLLVS